jgi:2-keto-4-pentenoate hydratase/2-oxohepta-3-ene-1,7-dioic acid hydratase in catechol pathway
MELYRLDAGIARRNGGELEVLDLPHPDIAALLADDIGLAARATVRDKVLVADAVVRSPISGAKRLILAGLAYRPHIDEYHEHLAEAKVSASAIPTYVDATAGPFDNPGDPIVIPNEGVSQVDYEGEVAIVIGKAARGVSVGDAWSHIGGLTIMNDVSERFEQRQAMASVPWNREWLVKTKRHRGFKPLGPALVTIDEFDRMPNLAIRVTVNGELRQQDRTSNMIFDFAEYVSSLSHDYQLVPGDIIATGTPAGVGLSSGRFLSHGDVVEITVDRLGTLRNPVVARRRVAAGA